jgi:8-oxo-dGTP pyrophosphatase MutT (NUDIX family)
VALHAEAVLTLQRWDAPDLAQEFMTEAFLGLLGSGPAAVHRDGLPRHLTASAVVLDPTGRQVLLTLHRKAQAWYQFGGHLEAGDESLHAAATRETREESGIPDLVLDPRIAQLSTHDLPAAFGRCRTHFDVRFVGTAAVNGAHAVSDESLDVRWWPVDALPPRASADLPALITAARRHLDLR